MQQGYLLQPELVVAWIRNDQSHPLLARIKDYFEQAQDTIFPALSSMSYARVYSSINRSDRLSPRDRETLQSSLRRMQHDRADFGHFFTFDLNAAIEWPDVRYHCEGMAHPPHAEVQMEYACARANQLAILAPDSDRALYPAIATLSVVYL